MTIFKNFDFDIILSFLLGLCIGLLFSNTVYADDVWNENNNFDNINTMTQFTTLNDILSDSLYSLDKESILDFVNNSDYDYKYIISYCNSNNCSSSSGSRSVDLIGFNKPIKMSVIQTDNSIKLNFIGDEGSVVSIYDHSQVWGMWGEIVLTNNSYVDYREYNNFRSIFDITYYSNFNAPLPNFYMSDTLFKESNFLDVFYANFSAFKEFIIFGVVIFIIICLICKKFHIFLTPLNYRGGGRF